jgi:hypothetical protein
VGDSSGAIYIAMRQRVLKLCVDLYFNLSVFVGARLPFNELQVSPVTDRLYPNWNFITHPLIKLGLLSREASWL